MKDGYWVRTAMNGDIRSLYKVDSGKIVGFDFKVGEFTECKGKLPSLGWDPDFDHISDEEGEKIYNKLKGKRKSINAK